jgi:hypothetical protein
MRERQVGSVDIVVIGRDSTRKRDFGLLMDDLSRALDKVGV